MLKRGSTGEAVILAQIELARLGYDIVSDGDFGAKTQQAVEQFQQRAGLAISGCVDAKTLTELTNRAEREGTKIPQTKHFDMHMFVSSADGHAAQYGIQVKYWANIQTLMMKLEILQKTIGCSLVIRSGYRSVRHNQNVGGATRSQHLYGKAADIYTADYQLSCFELARLIDETPALQRLFGGLGLGSNVNVHVDIRPCSGSKKPTQWWYTYKSWEAWRKA